MIGDKIPSWYTYRLPFNALYIIVSLTLFLLCSRVGIKFKGDIILVTLLYLEKSLQQNPAALLWINSNWLMLLRVWGPNRRSMFNNGSDQHLITVALNSGRTLVQVALYKAIYLICLARSSLYVIIP